MKKKNLPKICYNFKCILFLSRIFFCNKTQKCQGFVLEFHCTLRLVLECSVATILRPIHQERDHSLSTAALCLCFVSQHLLQLTALVLHSAAVVFSHRPFRIYLLTFWVEGQRTATVTHSRRYFRQNKTTLEELSGKSKSNSSYCLWSFPSCSYVRSLGFPMHFWRNEIVEDLWCQAGKFSYCHCGVARKRG